MDNAPTQHRCVDSPNNAPSRQNAETMVQREMNGTIEGQHAASSWVSLLSVATAASQTSQTQDTGQPGSDERAHAAAGTHYSGSGAASSQNHVQQPGWRFSGTEADWAGNPEPAASLGDFRAATTLARAPRGEATHHITSTNNEGIPTNEAIATQDLTILWPDTEDGSSSYGSSFFPATDQCLLTSSDDVQMLWDSLRLQRDSLI